MEKVYKPAEDSYLLARHVEKLVEGRVIDMGTGSGIQAVTAALKPQVTHVTAVDINQDALLIAEKRASKNKVLNKINFIQSDLFTKIDGKYKWIIFNPPYLRSEGTPDEASWAGGPLGNEVILRFLEEAPTYLDEGGAILLIVSSESNIDVNNIPSYDVEILEMVNLFFEKLWCLRISPS